MNICHYTRVRGTCRNINEHFHARAHRYQSTGCTRQLAEQCAQTRLTISGYSYICPGNMVWNVADCYCISSGGPSSGYSAASMCESFSLPLSLTFFLHALRENTEPLSASITHLIHHQCQAEEFWCQSQAACRNVLCVCVCDARQPPFLAQHAVSFVPIPVVQYKLP